MKCCFDIKKNSIATGSHPAVTHLLRTNLSIKLFGTVLCLCTTNNEKVGQPNCPAFIIFVTSFTQLARRRRKLFILTI